VTEFRQRQTTDPGLQSYWTHARAGSDDFKIIRGLLYRRAPWSSTITNDGYVLVLPASAECDVIQMGHDTPLSGHMGVKKTMQRVASEFYFPKMQRKIAQFVKCCHICQMVRNKRVEDRQPLQPTEVIDTPPFQDLTIDVMGGNLPVTAQKNRYVLSIICNATGWVEARPIKNCKAETIADELLKFFCDKGFPKVMKSDSMTSFKSEILVAVRDKLGIQARFSAPSLARQDRKSTSKPRNDVT